MCRAIAILAVPFVFESFNPSVAEAATDTQIFHAETAAISSSINENDGAAAGTMVISAFDRQFVLNLESNAHIFKDALTAAESRVVASMGFYKGRLANVEGSWARITVNGQAISGAISDGEELYLLDSVSNISEQVSVAIQEELEQSNSQTAIFRASDVATTASCATSGAEYSLGSIINAEFEQLRENIAARTDDASQEIPTDIYYDNLYSQNATEGAVAKVTSQMNIVDGVFSEQIDVQLTYAIKKLADESAIPSTEARQTLNEFRAYINQVGTDGVAHFFTGRNLDGGTAGIAWVGTICGNDLATGVSEAGNPGRSITIGSLIVAHELGHNFGAPHDNQAGSACATTPNGFIMNPSIGNNNKFDFSPCSLTQISKTITSRGRCITPISNPQNRPPVLSTIGATTNRVNDSVRLGITATDADGDTLEFSATELPTGLSLSSSGNSATISGTPTAPGTYNATVSVTDGTASDSETFAWTITDQPSQTPTVSLSQATLRVKEQNQGLEFTVGLSESSSSPVSVWIATVSGTATPGSDYYGESAQLQFAAGETSKTFQVQMLNDAEMESSEQFTVRLFLPEGATKGANDIVVVTIDDDDSDSGAINASVESMTVPEGIGTATIKLTLSNAATTDLTIDIATIKGTAGNGSDYYGLFQTVTFRAGETSKDIPVVILDDTETEGNETFTVRLFNEGPLGVSQREAIIEISDDD